MAMRAVLSGCASVVYADFYRLAGMFRVDVGIGSLFWVGTFRDTTSPMTMMGTSGERCM